MHRTLYTAISLYALFHVLDTFSQNPTGYCLGEEPFPVHFNTTTHKCENGAVVEIIKPPPLIKRPKTRRYTGPCEGPGDEFLCGGAVECGRKSGRRCCGRKSYVPARQTCCVLMDYDYKVYNKPEKENVCCWTNHTLYPRVTEKIPCLHPGKNDQLWRPLPLKLVDNEYKLCQTFSYGYLLRVGRKGNNAYEITSRQIRFSDDYKTVVKGRKFSTQMLVDRNSPRQKLTGRRYLILSRDEKTSLDFYLHHNDVVIKSRGRPGSRKTLMRTYRKALKLMRDC